jgi:hypothetical protein
VIRHPRRQGPHGRQVPRDAEERDALQRTEVLEDAQRVQHLCVWSPGGMEGGAG